MTQIGADSAQTCDVGKWVAESHKNPDYKAKQV